MNILFIDDQTLMRTGMRLFLASLSKEYYLFEAPDLTTATKLLEDTNSIDLVISEINIGPIRYYDILSTLRSICPNIPVLFYSTLAERLMALPALRAGASGFIMKGARLEELARAITMVGSGNKYMSVALQASLLKMMKTGQAMELESVESLSHRERMIMDQVVIGKSTSEIAHLYNLKSNTVSTYKKRIYKKMNVSDTFELSQKAICL